MSAGSSPVSVPVNALPREVDVEITVRRPQFELASDLSRLCFVTPDVPFAPNNNRVRNYLTFDSLIADTGWIPDDTGYWAAKAFFDQTVRPPSMSVGRVFEDPVPAQLMAAVITDFDALKAVTGGSFAVDITNADGVVANVQVDGINFSAVTNLASVAAAVNTAIGNMDVSDVIGAEVDYGGRLVITDKTGGASISYATASTTGTDVSGLLNLTQEAGAQKWDAYTPAGIVGEIQNIALAARAGGFPIFAWALDRKWRDTAEQRTVADWAQTQNWKAWALLCTNLPTAYDSADTTNIGFYCMNLAYNATSVIYHDNKQQYPEIAYAMEPLAVNYNGDNTVVNAAFKDCIGISPLDIDVTKHDILESRRINMFVRVGNIARTTRYGMQSAPTWWTDSFAGACNYREQLQVAVCNVLYRNKIVPYTKHGLNMILSAIKGVNTQFERNGYAAPRDVRDYNNENGYATMPAFVTKPTPFYLATDTERATRTLPPISITLYEAGAINHVVINVDIVN